MRSSSPSNSTITPPSEGDRGASIQMQHEQQAQTQAVQARNEAKRLSKRTIFTDIHDRLWRGYMWLDGSFPISMLEDWETFLLFAVVITLSVLLWYSIIFHLPNHVRHSIEKASYYIFGTSSSRSNEFTKSAAGLLQGAGKTARTWAEEL